MQLSFLEKTPVLLQVKVYFFFDFVVVLLALLSTTDVLATPPIADDDEGVKTGEELVSVLCG